MQPIKIPIQRWQVKFLLPTIGLMAAYMGAAFVVLFIGYRARPVSTMTALLAPTLCGVALGVAVMIRLDSYIGENASHVDLLKIPRYWIVTGLSMYCAGCLLDKIAGWELPPVVAHTALLLSGVLAVWVDEPGGPDSKRKKPGP